MSNRGPAERPRQTSLEALPAPPANRRRRLPPIVRAWRPLQWTKNGVIGAALVFGHRLFEVRAVSETALAILVFCVLSSGLYLLNDVRDAASDRLHPLKRRRPIAAGELDPRRAVAVACVMLGVAMAAAWWVRPAFFGTAGAYVGLMLGYTFVLKRVVIVDVFAIAAGFVLRAAAGAVAIGVAISPWLLVCTMLLALFLGFGKRRNELSTLAADAAAHRANLESYSLPLLDQLIAITAAATVMAYALYTFDAAAVPPNQAMMLTIPIVTYAVFRYLYLVQGRGLGGSPEALLFSDRSLLTAILAWGLASIAILYLFA